jgi:hypothetical protein
VIMQCARQALRGGRMCARREAKRSYLGNGIKCTCRTPDFVSFRSLRTCGVYEKNRRVLISLHSVYYAPFHKPKAALPRAGGTLRPWRSFGVQFCFQRAERRNQVALVRRAVVGRCSTFWYTGRSICSPPFN